MERAAILTMFRKKKCDLVYFTYDVVSTVLGALPPAQVRSPDMKLHYFHGKSASQWGLITTKF